MKLKVSMARETETETETASILTHKHTQTHTNTHDVVSACDCMWEIVVLCVHLQKLICIDTNTDTDKGTNTVTDTVFFVCSGLVARDTT